MLCFTHRDCLKYKECKERKIKKIGRGFCESTGTQLLTFFCVHLPVNSMVVLFPF